MMENKRARTQYFATISANVLVFGYGCGVAWLSLALPLLQSDNSPLKNGPISVKEVSWIGAAIPLGGLAGNLVAGYAVTFIGSRHCIFILGFPQFVSWLFMTFGTSAMDLAISRFLSGFVIGCVEVCLSLYVAEVADSDVRGRLGTISNYQRNFGVLFAYILGSYVDYIVASIVYAGVTILFFVMFLLVPSTPQYFLQKNNIEAAEKSFKFYNRHKLELDCSTQFENLKKLSNEVKMEPKITLKDIVESRSAMLHSVILGFLSVLCAQYLFLTYGSSIVEKAGTHLSSEVSSVSMAVVQILATFVAYMLIDSKGRKFLMVMSMIGCTLGHAIMIGYLYLYNSGVDTSMFHWTPIIGMLLVMFSSSFGVVPLAQICMAEYFPTKTRSFGLSLGSFIMNIFFFFSNKVFPSLMETIGLQECLLIFCVCCALGIFYSVFYVKETKGKDLNTVEDKKNVT